MKKNIQKLTTSDDRTLNQTRDILQEEVNFYRDLYSSKDINNTYMQSNLSTTELTKTLTQTDRENFEKPITINDRKTRYIQ